MFIQQMGYFQHIKRLFRKVQYQMQVMHIFLYLILNRKSLPGTWYCDECLYSIAWFQRANGHLGKTFPYSFQFK